MSGVRLRRRGIFGSQRRKRSCRRAWRLKHRNANLHFKRETGSGGSWMMPPIADCAAWPRDGVSYSLMLVIVGRRHHALSTRAADRTASNTYSPDLRSFAYQPCIPSRDPQQAAVGRAGKGFCLWDQDLDESIDCADTRVCQRGTIVSQIN